MRPCVAGSLWLTLFSFAVLVPAFANQAAAPATVSTSSKPRLAGSEVSFKDGQLTVTAQNFPIGLLANQLSEKAGVAVMLSGDIGSELVSVNFKQRPLDQGLREIFAKQDCFFFYGVDGDQPATLKALWVYPKGKGRGLQPVPPEQWESTKDLAATLSSKDPAVRGQAIETLVERKGNGAKDSVLSALHDSSEQVRSRALFAAASSGVDIPETVLRDLATNDTSADVRFLALQALSNRSDVRSIAEQALKDPNEAVRSAAEQIISRLNEQAGRPKEEQQNQDTDQPR